LSGNINTADPRYRALVDLATRENWSQASFSGALLIEAQRVGAVQAPAAPAKIEGWDKMTTSQRMVHAVAASDAARAARGKP
jgi:hypothetical protein